MSLTMRLVCLLLKVFQLTYEATLNFHLCRRLIFVLLVKHVGQQNRAKEIYVLRSACMRALRGLRQLDKINTRE